MIGARVGRNEARWVAAMVAVGFVVGGASLASAQSKGPERATEPNEKQPERPAQDPSLTSPGSEDAMLDSQKRPAAPPPIKPTRERPGQRPMATVPAPSSNIPGLGVFDFQVPGAKFYSEGTFLLTRKGVVVQSETGEYVFVPGKESAEEKAGPSSSPMVLMASQRLSQLAPKVTSPAEAVGVSVSGQVFVYRGRQYLLLSMFTFESVEAMAKLAAVQKEREAPNERASAGSSAEELMSNLERRSGTTRAMDAAPVPTRPSALEAEGGEGARSARGAGRVSGSVRPEGTVLTGRRGRIVRSGADRAISIAFDNDPDSPSGAPMPLLPCRLLESIESLVGQRGDSMLVKFSGRLTAYEGKNYVLPTMYQVVRPGDVAPRQ